MGMSMTGEFLPEKRQRAVTFRSLFFGFLGIYIMSGLSGYHDGVVGGPMMVGNHLPGGAFAYMVFVGLIWNGFWHILKRRSMMLNTKEMSIVLLMTFIACYPPTSGLGRYFHRMIMLPWWFLTGKAGWIQHGLLTDFLNPGLFPDPYPGGDTTSPDYDFVYRGFFTGLATGSDTVPLWKLPLGAWMRPLSYWGPMIFLFALSVISLQFVVHRQWAYHEQLSYPIAQIMNSFCRITGKNGAPGYGVPDIFRNRLFWSGMVPVFLLLLIEYLSLWFPTEVPSLKQILPDFRSWNLPVVNTWTAAKKVPGVWCLNGQTLFFTIVGIAYFVSSEISLTMGIAPILLVLFGVSFYASTGLTLDDQWISSGRAGAYIGYTMILLYTGRTYYSSVFKRAFTIRRRKSSDDFTNEAGQLDASIVAARLFVISTAAFMYVLTIMGCSWPMSIFFSLALLIMMLVISRVISETGVPFLQSGWSPAEIIAKLIGPAAMGPHSLTFLSWGGTGMLAIDPRESLMPYVSTGLKVCDDNKINLRRVFRIAVISVAVALVVAYLSSTYALYNYSPMKDSWASQAAPVQCFDQVARHFHSMKTSGVFEESLAATPLQRLKLVNGDSYATSFFVVGICAVVLCSMIRFRFSKFPLHPILFLVWGTYPNQTTWGAFLIGWFVKILVVKFGGGGVYQKMKPLFVGLISGELVMIGVVLIVDFVYFFTFGTSARATFSVLPG